MTKLVCGVFFLFSSLVLAQNQQTGDLNSAEVNTNSTVNSNNTTSNKTYNGAGSSGMPVPTAVAPSLMSSGNDSCLMSTSTATQFFVVGGSRGKYYQDPECNRRKNAKTLKELGLSIAAVSVMCTDLVIWKAMFTSGTPCPMLVDGKLVVGRVAYMAMKRSPSLYIPDYNDNKEYYVEVLGLNTNKGGLAGETGSEKFTDVDTRTISERFRTSTNNR